MNPLKRIYDHGQSIWLDYIRRNMTRSGDLEAMVAADGIRGMTSNPAIFQQAIAGSDDYADDLTQLVHKPELDSKAVYEQLATTDIREAADVLRPLYDGTDGADGYVSLEVSPSLAHDTEGTCEEARRLWNDVARPNLMIKVPGTPAGIAAIEVLLCEGININVTLLFAQSTYAEVAQAYVRALEARLAKGQPLSHVAGVASFFVSRIDTAIDEQLETLAKAASTDAQREHYLALRGKAAIANAKLAYEDVFAPLIKSPRWQKLAQAGARPQRLLWASTGTKNPRYRDVLYIEDLIGPETVNTAPPKTIDAFRDHGEIVSSLTRDVEAARRDLTSLADAGIHLDAVTDDLLERGLDLFRQAMDELLAVVAAKQRQARGSRLNRIHFQLPAGLTEQWSSALKTWNSLGNTQRLWQRDASLWTGQDEARWLGWLDVAEHPNPSPQELSGFAQSIRARGIHDILLLGMGGSSLCAEVLTKTYGPELRAQKWPKLQILDSTVPEQVQRVTARDPKHTLYVVASKSGSTLEPKAFLQLCLQQAQATLGDQAGEHFVAITDPGSALEAQARDGAFLRTFAGIPEIGGRYSALSNFGLVPAALMGLPIDALLAEARLMTTACKSTGHAEAHPAVALGLALGLAANSGRDKLTIVASPQIASCGAWIEQLVAESTGKLNKAITVVDGEALAPPHAYDDDRFFVYLRLGSTPDAVQDRLVASLSAAGHPVVQIDLDDIHALPQEFFRWEFVTAVAGTTLAVNPFDQPDVEASKVATRTMMAQYERDGALPTEAALWSSGGLSLFTDATNASALGTQGNLKGWLRAHLARLGHGDYLALLAYLDMNREHIAVLEDIRTCIRNHTKRATCLGFGPRFLHSSGQAYKGGPNTGVFIQLTANASTDIAVPGCNYGFAVVAEAQARGDLDVLFTRKRRAIRIHLGDQVERGLAAARDAVREAFQPV